MSVRTVNPAILIDTGRTVQLRPQDLIFDQENRTLGSQIYHPDLSDLYSLEQQAKPYWVGAFGYDRAGFWNTFVIVEVTDDSYCVAFPRIQITLTDEVTIGQDKMGDYSEVEKFIRGYAITDCGCRPDFDNLTCSCAEDQISEDYLATFQSTECGSYRVFEMVKRDFSPIVFRLAKCPIFVNALDSPILSDCHLCNPNGTCGGDLAKAVEKARL